MALVSQIHMESISALERIALEAFSGNHGILSYIKGAIS